MGTDGHDGPGVRGDRSGSELAVLQQTCGQHFGLAGQLSLQTPLSTSVSNQFPTSALKSRAVLSTGAAHHSTGKDGMIDAEGTDQGPTTIAGKTVGEGSKHLLRS